jgi:hypothetical protein
MKLDFSMLEEKIEEQKKCSNCENYVRGYCSATGKKALGPCENWTPKD